MRLRPVLLVLMLPVAIVACGGSTGGSEGTLDTVTGATNSDATLAPVRKTISAILAISSPPRR
ncbi:MAG TPA: hypothetical protein VI980_07760 [Acidimicrobiia bacterium]|nr:hypothetical protein [Acidimicrobiia bacterium]